MDDWNVNDIVAILLKDAALFDDRRKFARSLKIPLVSIKGFENEQNRQNDLHSYFCDVLEKWKSINGNNATIPSLINILRENKFVASADRLTHFYNGISTPVTVFGVKDPVYNFVGREQELNELNEWFKGRKSCVVLISAMGGKGKTELCRRLIEKLPTDNDRLVTWLSGDGEQQFQQSLTEIGQATNVQTKDSEGQSLPVEKIIENISNKTKSKWLVIIDNVDDVFRAFYKALDTFQINRAFVVVTSRRTDLDIQPDEYILLRDLEDKDACELVRTSLSKTKSQKLVDELCKYLQNYPLALQQAVAYIKHKRRLEDNSFGIEEYLQELNSGVSNAFDHKISSIDYDLTLLKVFELTLSKILSVPNNKALSLLQILSLVQPDGINKEFLNELFSFFELEKLFESSLSTLKSLSLIEVNSGEIFVHRTVQKLTMGKMKSENNFNLVINKLLLKLKTDTLKSKDIFHVIQIWNNVPQESEIIKINSNFAVRICIRLGELSLYRKMLDFSKITSQQFVSILESDHIETLKMQYQLGKALESNGEYTEALAKFQMVLEKEKKVLSEEHEEKLNCAGEIANVLWRLDRLDESLEWHERVLKSRIKVHGKNHQRTMTTKYNMALVLKAQGKIEEAFTIYKQVLEWQEKKVGNEDPETLITRHNIATCLYKQRKFVEAKKEFEEVLKLKVKVQGEGHANTLNTKYWLSLTLYSLGQKEEALEMREQVLILREKVLGLNHPQTNITRDGIWQWRMYQTIKNICTLY